MSLAVFTPTYNRADLLSRCYKSLLAQTDTDFVWLIIDDGSTDNTHQVVESWMLENKIAIRYIHQTNGGKHKAHNTAVEHSHEDYMLILDSDDILSADCVEILKAYVTKIDHESHICGIIANKYKISDGSVIGRHLPKELDLTTGRDLYQKYQFEGDTLRLYRVDVLKNFLFPVVPDERFMYENVVFDQIDAEYRMRVIHEKLYYCDYLPDGYTANAAKVKVDNPVGYSLSLNSAVLYSVSLLKTINWTILYIIWCRRMKIVGGFKRFSKKPLYCVLYPLALLLNILKQPKFFFRTIDQKIKGHK